MQREGIAEPVVARLLNHRSDTARTVTSAVYMRHAFAEEKETAMGQWDAHLHVLMTSRTGTSVTKIGGESIISR